MPSAQSAAIDGLDREAGECLGAGRGVGRQDDGDRGARGWRAPPRRRRAASGGRRPARAACRGRASGGRRRRRGPAPPPAAGRAAGRGRRGAAAGRRSPSAGRRPPSAAISWAVTARPAASRSSTQSTPFSAGERAEPGRPTTGRPACSPRKSRLPGSTGIPKRISRPPAATSAARQVSAASEVAEAPRISTRSPSASAIAFATVARLMRHAHRWRHRLAEAGEARAHRLGALDEQARLQPGRRGQDQRRPAGAEAVQADRAGAGGGEAADGAGELGPGDGVGDDLDRRHHLAGTDPRPVGERGQRDRRGRRRSGRRRRRGRRAAPRRRRRRG